MIALALGLLLSVVAVVALVSARPGATSAARAKQGREAPAFDLPDVRAGQPSVSLASFRGTPVVLNFWASWCVPCRKELPAFQAVAEQVAGRAAFVGVNHQDSRRLALALLEETGIRYPAAYDPHGKVAAANGLFGMPTTLFISAEGKILERRTGELSHPELQRTLKRLFGVT